MIKLDEAVNFNSYYEFDELKKIDDLDGEKVSLYEDCFGQGYVVCAVDKDNIYKRWMVVRVSVGELYGYLKGYKSLYTLIAKNELGNRKRDFVVIVDLRNDENKSKAKKSRPVFENQALLYLESVPESYLPDEDSFYIENKSNLNSKEKGANQ